MEDMAEGLQLCVELAVPCGLIVVAALVLQGLVEFLAVGKWCR